MAGIPAPKINLNETRTIKRMKNLQFEFASDTEMLHNCGSVGCIGGWLYAHPYFRKQVGNADLGRFMALWPGLLFGDSKMFYSSERHHVLAGIGQKREALRRLRRHLYWHGVITVERNAQLAAEEKRMKA